MRELYDWLPVRTRALLLVSLLGLLCVAMLAGYIVHATMDKQQQQQKVHVVIVTPTPTQKPVRASTPTPPAGFVLLWSGSGDGSTSAHVSPVLSPPLMLTAMQAQRGVTLSWRCSSAPSSVDAFLNISIRQGDNRAAWIGNTVQCGGSGSNFINTLHDGSIQVEVNATGPWTVRVLVRAL